MRKLHAIYGTFIFSILAAGPALAVDCTATAARTSGTHFKPITTQKTDVGRGLIVSGRILSAGDCKPIANARISHWQAGENGRYQDRLRAYLYSDKKGRYRFHTEWPAAIVPHIHFIVSTSGYETVGTQWVGNERTKEIGFDIVLRQNQ
ncbi:MAG: intradiol ring-cleavage dioxygenase [Acidiferrobacterales bacterium]